MNTVSRVLTSLGGLGFAAFCVFGFLASFEPGVAAGWKIGYPVAFFAALIGAMLPWVSKPK